MIPRYSFSGTTMRYRLRTILILVLAVSVILAIYRLLYAPPVLRIGMQRDDAIAAILRANAADIIRLSISSKITISTKVKPPTNLDTLEYQRMATIPYSEKNFQTYWYLPKVGRFETHFKDGKLESIVRWNGNATKETDRLVLELRPDNPNDMAGLPDVL